MRVHSGRQEATKRKRQKGVCTYIREVSEHTVADGCKQRVANHHTFLLVTRPQLGIVVGDRKRRGSLNFPDDTMDSLEPLCVHFNPLTEASVPTFFLAGRHMPEPRCNKFTTKSRPRIPDTSSNGIHRIRCLPPDAES